MEKSQARFLHNSLYWIRCCTLIYWSFNTPTRIWKTTRLMCPDVIAEEDVFVLFSRLRDMSTRVLQCKQRKSRILYHSVYHKGSTYTTDYTATKPIKSIYCTITTRCPGFHICKFIILGPYMICIFFKLIITFTYDLILYFSFSIF